MNYRTRLSVKEFVNDGDQSFQIQLCGFSMYDYLMEQHKTNDPPE